MPMKLTKQGAAALGSPPPCGVNKIGMCWISVLYVLYFLYVPYIIPYRFLVYFLLTPISPYAAPGAIQLAKSVAPSELSVINADSCTRQDDGENLLQK